MTAEQDRLLKQAEVKALLQVSDITLQLWRRDGRGPRYCKLGRCVRYWLSDVLAYIDSRTHNTEAA